MTKEQYYSDPVQVCVEKHNVYLYPSEGKRPLVLEVLRNERLLECPFTSLRVPVEFGCDVLRRLAHDTSIVIIDSCAEYFLED